MFTNTETFNALLRQASDQSSPLYSLRSFVAVYTKATKYNGKLDDILEIETGASVGTLFCFLANGSDRACGIDIAPIQINPKDSFFSDLKLLLGVVGYGGWYHRQMGHPSIREKLDLQGSWWDLNPERLASSIEYFAPYDAAHLPFEDKSFDLIYSGAVLEHIAHPADAIKEMHRILRPGGICIHGIDLRSHNNKGWLSLYTLTQKEHLAVSETYEPDRGVTDIYSGKWKGQVFCNRLLAHEWKELFLEKFDLLDYTISAAIKPDLINPSQFAPPFCEKSPDQLAPLTLDVVAKRV